MIELKSILLTYDTKLNTLPISDNFEELLSVSSNVSDKSVTMPSNLVASSQNVCKLLSYSLRAINIQSDYKKVGIISDSFNEGLTLIGSLNKIFQIKWKEFHYISMFIKPNFEAICGWFSILTFRFLKTAASKKRKNLLTKNSFYFPKGGFENLKNSPENIVFPFVQRNNALLLYYLINW